MNTLDHESPGLTDQLRRLSLEQRRQALTKAAIASSRQISNLEPQIRRLLESAARDNALSVEQIAEATAYAEEADDRYFQLQEQGAAEAIWKTWFAKSRLATGIINLFGGMSWQDAADAAYELCFTQDNKPAAIALVRAQIEAAANHDRGAAR